MATTTPVATSASAPISIPTTTATSATATAATTSTAIQAEADLCLDSFNQFQSSTASAVKTVLSTNLGIYLTKQVELWSLSLADVSIIGQRVRTDMNKILLEPQITTLLSSVSQEEAIGAINKNVWPRIKSSVEQGIIGSLQPQPPAALAYYKAIEPEIEALIAALEGLSLSDLNTQPQKQGMICVENQILPRMFALSKKIYDVFTDQAFSARFSELQIPDIVSVLVQLMPTSLLGRLQLIATQYPQVPFFFTGSNQYMGQGATGVGWRVSEQDRLSTLCSQIVTPAQSFLDMAFSRTPTYSQKNEELANAQLEITLATPTKTRIGKGPRGVAGTYLSVPKMQKVLKPAMPTEIALQGAVRKAINEQVPQYCQWSISTLRKKMKLQQDALRSLINLSIAAENGNNAEAIKKLEAAQENFRDYIRQVQTRIVDQFKPLLEAKLQEHRQAKKQLDIFAKQLQRYRADSERTTLDAQLKLLKTMSLSDKGDLFTQSPLPLFALFSKLPSQERVEILSKITDKTVDAYQKLFACHFSALSSKEKQTYIKKLPDKEKPMLFTALAQFQRASFLSLIKDNSLMQIIGQKLNFEHMQVAIKSLVEAENVIGEKSYVVDAVKRLTDNKSHRFWFFNTGYDFTKILKQANSQQVEQKQKLSFEAQKINADAYLAFGFEKSQQRPEDKSPESSKEKAAGSDTTTTICSLLNVEKSTASRSISCPSSSASTSECSSMPTPPSSPELHSNSPTPEVSYSPPPSYTAPSFAAEKPI